MLFKLEDREKLLTTSDAVQHLARDSLHMRALIDKNSEKIDGIMSSIERVLARLDLFIREFESVRPLVSEIKHAVHEVHEHCKSSKKKKK